MNVWQLQQAKARLSEVIKRAQTDGPQDISLHGKPAAVVMSHADYERLTRRHRLVDFIAQSPLKGMDLDLVRDRSPARDVDL